MALLLLHAKTVTACGLGQLGRQKYSARKTPFSLLLGDVSLIDSEQSFSGSTFLLVFKQMKK